MTFSVTASLVQRHCKDANSVHITLVLSFPECLMHPFVLLLAGLLAQNPVLVLVHCDLAADGHSYIKTASDFLHFKLK